MRNKVSGSAERPRLSFHRSLRHINAQIIDDRKGTTLVGATTNSKEFTASGKTWSNIESARKLGQRVGAMAREKGIEAVVFDRGGFRFHGVVKAFADAAREAGLKF